MWVAEGNLVEFDSRSNTLRFGCFLLDQKGNRQLLVELVILLNEVVRNFGIILVHLLIREYLSMRDFVDLNKGVK